MCVCMVSPRVIHQFWGKSCLLCPSPSPPYFKEFKNSLYVCMCLLLPF